MLLAQDSPDIASLSVSGHDEEMGGFHLLSKLITISLSTSPLSISPPTLPSSSVTKSAQAHWHCTFTTIPAFFLRHRFSSMVWLFFLDHLDTHSHKSKDVVLPFFFLLSKKIVSSSQFVVVSSSVGAIVPPTTIGEAEANNEEEEALEVIELEFLVVVEEYIFFSKMANRNSNARTEMVVFVWVWIIIIIDTVLVVVKLEDDGSIVPKERTFLAIDNT